MFELCTGSIASTQYNVLFFCWPIIGSKTSQMWKGLWVGMANQMNVFQCFLMFTPTWGSDPIWLILFRWVETTNQYKFDQTFLDIWSWLIIYVKISSSSGIFWNQFKGFPGSLFTATGPIFRRCISYGRLDRGNGSVVRISEKIEVVGWEVLLAEFVFRHMSFPFSLVDGRFVQMFVVLISCKQIYVK